MKKYLSAFVITMLLTLSMGCKKVYDYIESNPNADIKSCSILKFSFSDPYGTVDSISFTYNSNGDPVTGTRPNPRTGYPNYIFRYDKKGRLTDFIGTYGLSINDGIDFWHIYFYNENGKIALDSNYIFCRIDNGRPVDPRLTPEPDQSSLTYYTYDSHNRIIADSTIYLDGFIRVNQYAYDASGNKTGETYDQKTNFHRTNKIWMFLDREYSLNNPFRAGSYNLYGLPLKMSSNTELGLFSFAGNYFSEARITYSCK